MEKEISVALDSLEVEHAATVLYACESGSRAWGFPSPDSDYDVRFIYAHPMDWYLTVHPGRDVIEASMPHDLDLAGWDLRKALGLLQKSNPSLFEWIYSPIRYQANEEFLSAFRQLATRWYSRRRMLAHYVSMGSSNYERNLLGEEVNFKKYLYVLRPICAARWVLQHPSPAPVDFQSLVQATLHEPQVLEALESLLDQKRVSREIESGPRSAVLHTFIGGELERLKRTELPTEGQLPEGELDEFFRAWIKK